MFLEKLKSNQDFLEVLKKSSSAFLIRILGFLAGYTFMYLTVNIFGAETQGRLSLGFSFMIIGALICRLGVDIHFVKVFAINNNLNNARGIYFRIVPYIFILSFVVSSIFFLFSDYISTSFFNDPELGIYFKWTAPCILFYTFILVNASVFRGLRLNSLYSFLFNGGRFLFSLFVLGVLFFFTKNPIVVVIAHTSAIFILFIISIVYLFKHIFPFSRGTAYEPRTFIRQSLPMLFSATMIVFLGWADTIILGIYKDSSTVGIYSVVLKIAAVTSFSFQAIDSILAPKLSKAFHDDDMKLFKMLIKYSTIANIIISIVVVLFILSFKDLILSFFGGEFKEASIALIILCIGQLFNAICGPVGSILQMTGRQKIFQNILFIALIINITLNLMLIKNYGINGVAFATAFSLVFWNITSWVFSRKVINKN